MSDIIIYGRGKTGQSLYKMLQKLGKQSIFYDDERGFDGSKEFDRNSLVILSPGVSPYADGVLAAKKTGARVIGELEFCLPFIKGQTVSVTGTNGKTTTCEMIRHILQAQGRSVYLLGNGGIPLSEKVLDVSCDDIIVLESSSFQLAECNNFSPYISVCTSFACDHLNYHGSMNAYREAKINNFAHQNKSGYAIFNADDEAVVEMSKECACSRLYYSMTNRQSDCYCDGSNLFVNTDGNSRKTDISALATLARHNLSNALAAILTCKLLGVSEEFSVCALQNYRILPHRLQTVDTLCGVTFVDDSKATNVHATVSALNNYNTKIALILGGSDKGESFDPIFENIKDNVKLIVAVGETARAISDCGREHNKEVVTFGDIKQATVYCYGTLKALGGGTVLMSNACASFDKFKGYAERGDYFQRVVRELHSDEEKN